MTHIQQYVWTIVLQKEGLMQSQKAKSFDQCQPEDPGEADMGQNRVQRIHPSTCPY